jgi:hypothetical protein
VSRRVLLALVAGCWLASAACAGAADTTVATDPAVHEITALDGTIVWSTGVGQQTLMLRTGSGTRRVPGATAARFYRTVDLGHDRHGRLVLTYQRCGRSGCASYRDDLHGHRFLFRGMALPRCSLTTAPSLWGNRAAYGLSCHNGRVADDRRSGLYVRTGSGTPRHLPRPHDAAKFGITSVSSVDLTGQRVAAVLADVYAYAFSETTSGRAIRAYLAAASEGDSDEQSPGLSLTPTGALWSLTDASHADDPRQTVIHRLAAGCQSYATITSPAASEDYAATDLAVDGRTVYLAVPNTGIVTHSFTPTHAC